MDMDPKGKKLMTIFAHADDAEIWAGGSLVKWNNSGGESLILCFNTDDSRMDEGKRGAEIMGSSFESFDNNSDICPKKIKTIEKIISEYKPDIIITHHKDDSHPDHRNVFQVVSSATVTTRINDGKPNMLLCADTYNDILLEGTFNPNIYIDISEHFDTKLKAIEQHKSQPFEMWKKVATEQNTFLGSRLTNVKYAEGFIQVPILGKLATISLF